MRFITSLVAAAALVPALAHADPVLSLIHI